MVRTQIYLTELQLKVLKQQAFADNITISRAIRDLIERELISFKPKKKKKNIGSVLLEMAKEAEAMHIQGPKDLSKNIDKYLYGEDVI